LLLLVLFVNHCTENSAPTDTSPTTTTPANHETVTKKGSWAYFLQHLPEKEGPVVDFTGRPVRFQQKHTTVIDYDIGNRDLQQCADALMRLRAEYLFSQQRFNKIHFHFTSGHDYSFLAYCRGQRPVVNGNQTHFVTTHASAANHQSLRRYLDLVYAYAGTLSLAKELKPAKRFTIGTVVISPGSPGHCFIICNEAVTPAGDTLYKLVEGYTPAQSMYVLNNVQQPQLGCWHKLQKGVIKTASYTFTSYQLKAFE